VIVDSFAEFIDHVSAQLPDHYFVGLPDEQLDTSVGVRAAYLWSLLQLIHEDLNALCRRSPAGILGQMSIRAINKAFIEVKQLLDKESPALFLSLLNDSEPPMHADALVMVSLYQAALRGFRIDKLGEDPMAF
jgi:hypothetical protein